MLESNPPPGDSGVRYEKSDASIKGVVAFGVILLVIGLIVYVTVIWLFDDLKFRENRKYQPLPSLAAKNRVHFPDELDKIRQPRLQKNEPLDLAELHKVEEASLSTYGWVDRKDGIVRIPIDEAMRLLSDPTTATVKGIRVRKK